MCPRPAGPFERDNYLCYFGAPKPLRPGTYVPPCPPPRYATGTVTSCLLGIGTYYFDLHSTRLTRSTSIFHFTLFLVCLWRTLYLICGKLIQADMHMVLLLILEPGMSQKRICFIASKHCFPCHRLTRGEWLFNHLNNPASDCPSLMRCWWLFNDVHSSLSFSQADEVLVVLQRCQHSWFHYSQADEGRVALHSSQQSCIWLPISDEVLVALHLKLFKSH